ncbi:MAG TPA: sugar ABC transporter permease [Deinococcales bacterium]|nr:sugar ABC transporter permease [Deinococcales bacterium]
MATLQARSAHRRSQSLEATQARTAWWLVLPSLIVVVLVAGYPLVRTIALSFTDASFFNPGVENGVGFANYTRLFSDQIWWRSVQNTVVFTFFSVAIEFVLGLFVAMVINSNFKGRGLVRTAMLVPWAIPTVISAQMWKWMFNDVIGVINDLFIRAHIISHSIGWLANPSTTMPSIIAVDIWKTTPFVALLLLAGLQTIPADIYEAARVDGASAFTQFWRLTLPLLRPAILVTLVFRTLDALRVFDVIYVMTGTTQNTASMAVYDRQQLIDFGGLGFGSAASVIIFLIIAVFTVGYVTSLRVRFD